MSSILHMGMYSKMYLKHPVQRVFPNKVRREGYFQPSQIIPLPKPMTGALVRQIAEGHGRSATGLISQGFNQRRRSAGLQCPESTKSRDQETQCNLDCP
jgi:hypothetical protein